MELLDLNSQSTIVGRPLKPNWRFFFSVDGDSRKIGPFRGAAGRCLRRHRTSCNAQESYAILMLEIHGNADAAARNLNMKTFLWITTASSSELCSCINNLFHQKFVQGVQASYWAMLLSSKKWCEVTFQQPTKKLSFCWKLLRICWEFSQNCWEFCLDFRRLAEICWDILRICWKIAEIYSELLIIS